MIKREPLPLASANWQLLEDAHALRCQQVGSSDFASLDLLTVFQNATLRTKMRDDRHELLLPAPSFDWNDVKKLVRGSDRVWPVFAKGTIRTDTRIYVWKPDFEEMWGCEADPPRKPKKPPEVPVIRGRTMAPEWREIYGEIAFQLFVNKRKKGKRLTDAIETWCRDNSINVPNRRDLERAIAALAKRVP